MTARARHSSLLAIAGLLAIATVAAAAATGVLPRGTSGRQAVSAAGSITLTTDDGGAPLFTIPATAPGHTSTRCVRVDYAGPDGVPVKLSAADDTVGNLGSYIDIAIDAGTGGGYGDCAGFSGQRIFTGTLAQLEADHPDNASGLSAFVGSSTTPNQTFRFTVTVHDDNAAQGRTAGATLAWTAVDDGASATPSTGGSTPVATTDAAPPPAGPTATTPSTATTPVPTTTTTKSPRTDPTPSDDSLPTTPQPAASSDVTPAAASPTPGVGASGTPSAAAPVVAGGTSSPGGGSGTKHASARGTAKAKPTPTNGLHRAPSGGPAGDTSNDGPALLRHIFGKRVAKTVGAIAHAVSQAAGPVAERSAFPAALLAAMVLFLFFQDAIDRRDPKLALAPMRSDDLPFTDGPDDDPTP
jgi:hypothetical protein